MHSRWLNAHLNVRNVSINLRDLRSQSQKPNQVLTLTQLVWFCIAVLQLTIRGQEDRV